MAGLGGRAGGSQAAVLLVLALVGASCAACSGDDDPAGSDAVVGGMRSRLQDVDTSVCGVDPEAEIGGDTLRLVSSYPQSGEVAPLGQIATGWQAYFDMVNDDDGVEIDGHDYQIKWATLDDGYDPVRTAENIDQLVGDGEDVFAAFGVVGTTNNLAIRDHLNDLCVPDLFAASGSPAWGNPEYPWTMGSTQPPYSLEAEVFVRLLQQQKPDAKIAMLVQDDDFGNAYEQGVRHATQGTGMQVVAVAQYAAGMSVDVSPQVEYLAGSGADVFFDGATLLPCPAALQHAATLGWARALTWVSGTCLSRALLAVAGPAGNGVYSMANLKDPQAPEWAADGELKRYRRTVAKYFPEADPGDGLIAYGWTQAAIFVEALEQAEAPSRSAVVAALHNLDLDGDVGLLLPGTGIRTGPDDAYLGERVSLVQHVVAEDGSGNHFAVVGNPYNYEGETLELTPADLVV
jgi:branched-chain amino acid transport system substrate-binding protein